MTYSDFYDFLHPGDLLGGVDLPPQYRVPWDLARADSFVPSSQRMKDPVSIAAE